LQQQVPQGKAGKKQGNVQLRRLRFASRSLCQSIGVAAKVYLLIEMPAAICVGRKPFNRKQSRLD
jgi:hypothetical protein